MKGGSNRLTIFITWEPLPLDFVKINFDGSVRGRFAGSAFVIRGSDGATLAADGFGLLDASIPSAELYEAWAGISYATRVLEARRLIIKEDSLTIIRWIRKDSCNHLSVNPLIQDIWLTLQDAYRVLVRHVYRESNSTID